MAWFFLTIVAVFFIAAEAVFEKKTLIKARSLEFAAMFAFANMLVLVPFLFFINFSQINPFILALIFFASMPAASASLLMFKTIKHSQLSETAPILALAPLVITFFAFIFLGERITILQSVGLFLMVGGIILLEFKNLKTSQGIFIHGRGKYIYYIFLYLLLGGISAMFDRIILNRYHINPLAYLALIQLFIAMNYFIFFSLKPANFKNLKEGIAAYWKVILVVSILTVCHRYLYASAIQLAASIGLVSAVYKLSSLVHVISGGKFFSEKDITKKVLASVIILSGTILLVLK